MQLERSRLKVEDFKEVTKQIQDFEWEKDDDVKSCKLCTKDFNVARRKHHCRRLIYYHFFVSCHLFDILSLL